MPIVEDVEKPADQFALNRRVCKSCRREQNQVWEAERVERRREQHTYAPGVVPDDDEEGPQPTLAAADGA